MWIQTTKRRLASPLGDLKYSKLISRNEEARVFFDDATADYLAPKLKRATQQTRIPSTRLEVDSVKSNITWNYSTRKLNENLLWFEAIFASSDDPEPPRLQLPAKKEEEKQPLKHKWRLSSSILNNAEQQRSKQQTTGWTTTRLPLEGSQTDNRDCLAKWKTGLQQQLAHSCTRMCMPR